MKHKIIYIFEQNSFFDNRQLFLFNESTYLKTGQVWKALFLTSLHFILWLSYTIVVRQTIISILQPNEIDMFMNCILFIPWRLFFYNLLY